MPYRSIFYLLCTMALILSGGGVVSAEDVLSDETGMFGGIQGPLFSTVFEFDDSVSMEELLESCQTEVELTGEEFVLVEAVFANALTGEAEIQEFETPTQVSEELPIAPTSLVAEEVPDLMLQLAVANPEPEVFSLNIESQGEPVAATVATAASTIIQGSSAIMQGFNSISNFEFTSSFITGSSIIGSSTIYSNFFADPYRTYPPVVTSTYLTLSASPENPRPGEYLTLAGNLRDQYGRSIPGAQVRILRTDERGIVASIGTARTDFNGNYVFRTVATPGVYWYRSEYRQMPGLVTLGYSNSVRITCISYQNWEVTLTAMPTTGYIGDRILLYGFVLSDGLPVGSGAPVELQYQYGGKWYRIVQRQTDPQGVFAYPLQAVSPGTIIVRAVFNDPYGVQKVSSPVPLNIIRRPMPMPNPPGAGNAILTLYTQAQTLPSYGTTIVYGWLSTGAGAPLAGMPIVIESQMQRGNSAGMRSTEHRTTRADGSYEITLVATQGTGTLMAQAYFPGSGPYPAVESKPLTIPFGGRVPVSTPTPTTAQVTKQVQITAQYSPSNPRAGDDVTVVGTLTTITGQPVSGAFIEGYSTMQAGRCQATAQNRVNTDAAGNYRYVFQPSCDGEAHVSVKFDGTPQFNPVSVSFRIPIDKYQPNPTPIPMSPGPVNQIPMEPIVMMSLP